MKLIRRFLIISSFLYLLTACENRYARYVLNNVEGFIQERPDSALKVLGGLTREELNSNELRARYSLLYATALDKTFIDTTNLSIILPASEYFSKHGSSDEKMRSYFYQGRIYSNRGDVDQAMYYYLLALEDSAQVKDNHYKELVNSAISDLYSRNHNHEQELQYSLDALRYGRMDRDSIGIWAITGHIASCYGNLRMEKESENAYHDFFSMPVYDTITYAGRRISYAKDLLRKQEPEAEHCIDVLENIANNIPSAMTVEAYCVYAYAQQMLGNSTIANNILEQLDIISDDHDIVKLWRYRIFPEQGRYEQAIEDLERSVLVQDSIVVATLRQSLIRSQRDYLKAETQILKKENQIARQRIILIIITSLVLVVALFLMYFRRRATFNKKLDELSALHLESQHMLDLQNARTASMNAELEEKEAALLHLRKQFASMYKAQYKTLNDLCAAYLSPVKKDRKDVLYDEAMRQLEIIVNDKDSQDRFMSIVNNSLDNIIDKLRKDLPSHKEQDFRFLMYIIVGFDATTIANLTGYSVGTVYTKKNRLKGVISCLSSPFRDFYLQFID